MIRKEKEEENETEHQQKKKAVTNELSTYWILEESSVLRAGDSQMASGNQNKNKNKSTVPSL